MEPKRKPGTFVKGDPRAGRPPGRPNKATHEIRQLAQSLLTDPQYLKALRQRLREGTAGRIEDLLYQYAWGAPSTTSIDAPRDPSDELETIVVNVRERTNGHHRV
jgi:hypothetical protein